jgi:hypothetical protein
MLKARNHLESVGNEQAVFRQDVRAVESCVLRCRPDRRTALDGTDRLNHSQICVDLLCKKVANVDARKISASAQLRITDRQSCITCLTYVVTTSISVDATPMSQSTRTTRPTNKSFFQPANEGMRGGNNLGEAKDPSEHLAPDLRSAGH